METLITERNGRLFLTNTARVVRAKEDVTEDMAAAANWETENSNPFIKWLIGDFVEADNANSNTQMWTRDDLALGEYSIKYAPLNMLHKQTTPVGFFASTRTIDLTADRAAATKPAKGKHKFIHPNDVVNQYGTPGGSGGSLFGPDMCVACGQPAGDAVHEDVETVSGSADAAKRAVTTQGTAKIEALSGMWSHVFPFEAALVDQADEMGALFYSMECRGTHLHCAGPNGCDKTFDYMKPEDQCAHLRDRTSVRHIVNPTFRGGALIIPPTEPGWANARASVVQNAVREEAQRYAELTEQAFNQVNTSGAQLTPSAWEYIMASVLSMSEPSR